MDRKQPFSQYDKMKLYLCVSNTNHFLILTSETNKTHSVTLYCVNYATEETWCSLWYSGKKMCIYQYVQKSRGAPETSGSIGWSIFKVRSTLFSLLCIWITIWWGKYVLARIMFQISLFFSPKVKTCEKNDVVFRIIFLSLCFTHEKKIKSLTSFLYQRMKKIKEPFLANLF